MVSKRYLKLTTTAAIMLALVGCKTFEGQITVKEQLKFVEKKNNIVDIGTHDAKLTAESEKLVVLEVSKAGNNNNAKIKFKIPKHDLPSYDGGFDLTAEQTGQPYDVHGDIRTKIQDGPEKFGKESCYYYDWVTKCHKDKNGNKYCQDEKAQVRGEHCIRYFDRITTQDITFDLFLPNTRTNVSTFDGRNVERQPIKTWEDYRCERYASFCHDGFGF